MTVSLRVVSETFNWVIQPWKSVNATLVDCPDRNQTIQTTTTKSKKHAERTKHASKWDPFQPSDWRCSIASYDIPITLVFLPRWSSIEKLVLGDRAITDHPHYVVIILLEPLECHTLHKLGHFRGSSETQNISNDMNRGTNSCGFRGYQRIHLPGMETIHFKFWRRIRLHSATECRLN